MEELVKRELIAAGVEAHDWKDAIEKAGDLLVKCGDIERGYIEQMIASVEEYGPYMVITKGFALAHAAPSEAVRNDSMSLINLKEPVEFGSRNDPVSVVLCLACIDKESHMEKLQKVAMRLMVPGMVERLSECENADALYREINGENKEV